jgi:hypothetical protein
MKIIIILYCYRKYLFGALPNDTVFNIKQNIQKRFGINKFMQKLELNTIELENRRKIYDYVIKDGDYINVKLIINRSFIQKNIYEYNNLYSFE